MNTFKISYFIVVLIIVLLAIACEPLRVEANHRDKYGREIATSQRSKNGNKGVSATLTCNQSSKVCRLKGSLGRDCCRKRCVDLRTNNLNCGRCGKSCLYSEICCKGYCVNIMFDKRHCGGCFQKCNKGRSCAYGMCNYA
ncbi:unnamed protein product [Cochlearia groenlandica]